MPSNKTFVTLVLCMGIVVSAWLVFRPHAQVQPISNQNTETTVSAEPLVNIQNANDDWKKILVTVDPKNEKVAKPIKADDSTFNDTTLTAQIAMDFFSQYLILKKSGKDITDTDVQTITNNTLALPKYTQTTGALYVASNLHINQKIDTVSVKQYYDQLNAILKKLPNDNVDPALVVKTAIANNDENELKKLDPLIKAGKSAINDFLAMQVPADAVTLHLALLNASSNILSNWEGMRETFTDPVKSFASTGQYGLHLAQLQTATRNLQTYFVHKLGTGSKQ